MKPATFLRDASLILAISIALLAALEAILRLAWPDAIAEPTPPVSPKGIAYQFNKHYLVSLKPNMKRTYGRSARNGGDVIEWQTNADSFRGPNLRPKPAARIIVYGDSNIEARASKTENTYPFKLGTYLNTNGAPDIEVVNAGIIGFGPDQSLIRFALEADTYKPNLVVFHVFADNDFGDIVRNRLFDLGENDTLIKTTYERTPDQYLLIDDGSGLKKFFSRLLIVNAVRRFSQFMRSGNVNMADERLKTLQKLTADEYAVYKHSLPRKVSHFADHYDIDIALDPDGESSKVKVKLMAAILKEASNVAISRGIEFLVLIQPSRVDVTEHGVLNYRYLERFPKYRRSRLTDVVEQICREKGIGYVNLFEIFMRNRPDDLFFKGNDEHWNDQGQDLAAKETASYIVAHKMLARMSSRGR